MSRIKKKEDKMFKEDKAEQFTFVKEGVTITAKNKEEAEKKLAKKLKQVKK